MFQRFQKVEEKIINNKIGRKIFRLIFWKMRGKNMSKYDEQYLDLVEKILTKGYYDQNRTGIATYKLPHQILQFNLEEEFPILTTKFVAFKAAVKELLWIFQKQSNKISDLHDQNVHIWDEWEMEDGTIGTSYGWVVKEFKQVDKLIIILLFCGFVFNCSINVSI